MIDRHNSNSAESKRSHLSPSRVFLYALPFLSIRRRGVPFWPGLIPILRYYRKWVGLYLKNRLI
ncbi:MAG: hypothetical protein AB2598_02905 [Candidatus Thiodiazotropha sp.]